MKKTLFILVLVIVSLWQTAYAGLVPGTIQKSGYTSSNTCNDWTSDYSPSGGGCYQGSCKVTWAYNCSCGNAVACSPQPDGSCTWWSPDSMSCYCGCSVFYSLPQTNGTLTFHNYTPINNNSPTFASDGSSRHLSNDNPQSCNRWANGTNHIAPTKGGIVSCVDGSSSYYVGWSNGECKTGWFTNNLISTFDQVWSVTRSSPGGATAGNSTCTVEWRYATADDAGPIATINTTSVVFDADVNNWCSMNKYLAADYGTAANPELAGCTYYKSKVTHANASDKHPDLLENLDITVDDVSGISQVVIEIGESCSATYNLATDVASVVASTSAASGVKPSYKNITFKYNATSTNGGAGTPGQGLPSLLSQFGKDRLDRCLTEGKNFLRVTMKDNARSDSDGVTYAPNTAVLDYSAQSKFIKIDNSGSKIGLTGDAKKIAEANAPANCFVGGATLDNQWKNYTISGSLLSADPFGANTVDCSQKCTVLTSTGYVCTSSATKWSIPVVPNGTNHFAWTAPGGVNPTTGAFTGYTCDGLGPIPSTASCDWGCTAGYAYDSASQKCVQSSNLFILFDAGTSEASGPFAAKLTNDPNTSHGLVNSKTTACATPANAVKSERSSTFKYQAGASYSFSTAPSGPFPIIEDSAGVCTPTCWTNYTAKASTVTSPGSQGSTGWVSVPNNWNNTIAALCAPLPATLGRRCGPPLADWAVVDITTANVGSNPPPGVTVYADHFTKSCADVYKGGITAVAWDAFYCGAATNGTASATVSLPDGGTCVANTQNAACALPTNVSNTIWNTSGTFQQTWLGTSATTGSWTPATPPATTYDTVTGACHYKCASGANWNSTTQSCDTPSYNRWCYTSSDGKEKFFTTAFPWAIGGSVCGNLQADGTVANFGSWGVTNYLNGTITCISSTSPIPDSQCSLNNICIAGGTVPCVVGN